MSPRVIRVACPQSHRKSHRHAPDGRELSRRPAPGFMSERRYRDDVYVLAESSVRHHDAAPLDLFATASLRWLQGPLPLSLIDRRRFRPNMCSRVPGSELVEDGWVGRRFKVACRLRHRRAGWQARQTAEGPLSLGPTSTRGRSVTSSGLI
jgi:uncharacterized protein YcbX